MNNEFEKFGAPCKIGISCGFGIIEINNMKFTSNIKVYFDSWDFKILYKI